MNKWIFFLLLVFLSCSACDADTLVEIGEQPTTEQIQTITPTEMDITQTLPLPTKTSKPSTTATFTPQPTKTQTSTPTQTYTPSITPTFDAAQIETVTPVVPNTCPELDSNVIPPDFEKLYENYELDVTDYLDYLNAGGSWTKIPAKWQPAYQLDLTNDNVEDYVLQELRPYSGFGVLSCQNGQYQAYLKLGTVKDSPKVISIEDANANGIPEIVTLTSAATMSMTAYKIYEWDGNDFQNLVAPNFVDMEEDTAEIYWRGPFRSLTYEDLDRNGTLELIWEWDLPIWSMYSDGLPWREETRIYTWNGSKFNLHEVVLSPPEFRFQAIQDGDLAVLARNYDAAFRFYWAAIEDDDLDWWTLERRYYEQSLPPDVIKPTPEPTLLPDLDEYPNLVAYAYYRIMLLNLLLGLTDEAQTTYETLQEEYLPGSPGYAYAEMAKAFWQEYQISGRVENGCAQAVQYARNYPEKILFYIGNSKVNEWLQFGEQGIYYHPEDICPFQ